MADREGSLPLYQQIFSRLSGQIASGVLSPGSRLPTEQELCDEYGVSRITVKRALSELASRELIERIPGKGSFVRAHPVHSGSASTTSDTPDLVGVIVDDFGESFGTRLLYSIEDECGRLGYRPVLFRSRSSMDREEAAVADSLRLGVAGLIVNPIHGEFYSSTQLSLVVDGTPLVFVGNYLSGLRASYSGSDNFAAALAATQYLFDLGHKRIAFMSTRIENTYAIERRRDGYNQAHLQAGIVPDPTLILEHLASAIASVTTLDKMREDIDRICEFLRQSPEVTAVLADEYAVATVVRQAAKEMGKQIPEQLSIVTFDSPANLVGDFEFTHMSQDEDMMGRNAVRLLHEQIMSDPEIRQVLLPAELKIGLSTAPFQDEA